MASSSYFHLIISSMLVATLISATNASVADHEISWMSTKSGCQGSMADCGEFDMEFGINRRVLVANKYISYGALQANSVPCSLKGASYYNCQPGGEANPYNRQCSAVTDCRS
ncbi:Protein RALF-like 33 [Abeliophyllum distichum]|uniref:Protein RALF-like 33 n=1 Tax=Abeliophyllum distichum TaxID=126358 RepID=A0ABD1VT40_9LAMI